MQRLLQRLFPSMFHRRVLLLAAVMLLPLTVLAGKLSYLTLAQGAVLRSKAEAALSQRRLIPASRGRILDRHQRVLARSKPTYDISVAYPVISGQWAYKQALDAARRENRSRWAELSTEERDALVDAQLVRFDGQVEGLWSQLAEFASVERSQIEQRINEITGRVQKLASNIWVRRLLAKQESGSQRVSLIDVAQPVGEQLAAHAVLSDVDETTLVKIKRAVADASGTRQSVWSQVQVEPSKIREYPLETITLMIDRSHFPAELKRSQPVEVRVEGVATHIVGQLRQTFREDVEQYPMEMPEGDSPGRLDGYLAGDEIGRSGIEAAMERQLRGTRGVAVEFLDTGRQQRIEPQAGRDVVLTIDAQLQARIQALMDPYEPRIGLMQRQAWHERGMPESELGRPLCGAAVVLEIATGQVLAAVSAPGYSLRQLRSDPASIFEDRERKPYLFRPVGGADGGVYEPGSTAKPLVLAAAIADGEIPADHTITCNGFLDPDHPDRFRCWIYRHFNGMVHGPLTGPQAIARSCNIYFYTLGDMLGPQRLTQWYARFGLGQPTRCGLPEHPGDLPSSLLSQTSGAMNRADGVLMAIGQGPIRWTPLQAANAYATLARGGYMLSPTFLIEPQSATRDSHDLELPPAAVDTVLRGMEMTTNETFGTAHHLSTPDREPIFNLPGVKVYGKSGTATAAPLRVDTDADGRITRTDRIVRQGDHAWFAGFVQRQRSARPDYVVVVVVEYAGSGGAAAGPIANQILHALRAEGYL